MHIHRLSYWHKRQAVPFFSDLTFQLEPGKLHALHGKNGVGKTVLLNLLSGRMDPHARLIGKVESEGVLLVNQRVDEMIADQYGFEENVQFARMGKFPLPVKGLKPEINCRELLDGVSIDFHVPASQLSGGQRQILALLMVLQKTAKVLLLDEPTAALDEENALMVFTFLRKLNSLTLLVVCHDKELITQFVNGTHFTLEKSQNGERILRES